MQPIFTSATPFESERVQAVAVYCSDGRYGDQIDAFLHQHLGLPNYDRLAIVGGPAWLGFRSSASISQYGLMRDQLDFLVHVHGLRRVVLLAHYGCAYYLRRHVGDADSVLPTQIQDLRDAARTIRNWYTTLQVETYLARAEGGRVDFYAISES
jgi:carbonic anhydrase-like protein